MSGTVVYGTSGTAVFKINNDGTGAQTLHTFAGSPDGAHPKSGLALNGGMLYGTTYSGGSGGYGTVFAINTNGSNYSILYNFTNGVDGANPQAELLWNQGMLYGTAGSGGSFGQGTVFRLNPDGTGYTVLRAFTNTPDGANPQAGLALVGTTFYGTTCYGGSAGEGTIFQLNADGSGYQVIRSFQGWGTGDGIQPSGTLKVCCGALYGVTTWGGTHFGGTIYRLTLPPPPLQIVSINNQPVVFWEDDGFTHSLEMTTNLASGVWTTVSNGAPIIGVQITNVMQLSNGFFRLR